LIIKNEKKDTPPDYASVFSAGVRGFAKNEKRLLLASLHGMEFYYITTSYFIYFLLGKFLRDFAKFSHEMLRQ